MSDNAFDEHAEGKHGTPSWEEVAWEKALSWLRDTPEDLIAELKGDRTWQDRVVAALSDRMRLPWDEKRDGFLTASDAILLMNAKYSELNLTYSKLNTMLNSHRTVRFMRKGQRCRVHINDLLREFSSRDKPVTDEDFEDMTKRYAEIQAKKKQSGF